MRLCVYVVYIYLYMFVFNSTLINGFLWLYSALSHYSLSDIKVPMRLFLLFLSTSFSKFVSCAMFRPGFVFYFNFYNNSPIFLAPNPTSAL
ncbi:hypothetical protein CLU79DRAFT_751422 [Phycomyces nitens]|nr:hypothetical protein CLU79DRAFT_751422 [Phycomyces nitens]